MNPQRLTGSILDTEHRHVTKTDEQLTDTNRVPLHRGPPGLDGSNTTRLAGPLSPTEDPYSPQGSSRTGRL
jgi:hypothetical protein